MIKKTIKSLLSIAMLASATGLSAQEWFTPEVEQRAEQLLKQMTLHEKLIYIGGIDWMYTRDFPRLGITRAKMTDGPQGVGTWGASTAYPCDLMLASSFNRDLAYAYGKALATDCKERGVDILLGPAVNIARAPMCGRNFEYMGEDPYLAAQTSTGYIKGLQDNGVMAVIKHFTANFQEYDRNYISSDIDERTLHEIYFPAFKSAVQVAGTGAIMSSYNLLNGVWTTESPELLKGVLRDKWGFNGLVMSDWGSTHNCVPAVKSGLDLEMAGNEIENEDALREHLASGEISIADIDLKVKHILQTLIGFGVFDKNPWNGVLPATDNFESAETALEVSRDGVVLLKNEDSILPLNPENGKKIGVVGNNALIFAAGGGSGLVTPFQYTSYFDGLKELAEARGFEVTYIDQFDHMTDALFESAGSSTPGLKAEYFNNRNLSGSPVATSRDTRIGYEWTMGCGVSGVNKNDFSVRWTGVVRPTVSGQYTFRVGGDDGYRFTFNNKVVIDEYKEGSLRTRTYTVTLNAGQDYPVCLEYFQAGGGASIDFAWERKGDENRFENQLNGSDVIVAFIGHSSASEGEASDRSAELPDAAKDIMNKVRQATTRPIVAVVNGGGNIYMWDMEPDLRAILWGWYGGQEAGIAMAEILLGDVNPSGKLPVSFEKQWADNPSYNSYYDTDGDKHVRFTEGIFIGYRGHDKNKTQVQYPFGYGLSYTTFELSDMTATTNNADGDNLVEVTFNIRNTGKVAGAEVVQLYVGKESESPVERPVRELKNYEKIYLEPGESQTVTMTLPKDAFTYYDVTEGVKDFVVDNGTYRLDLGVSSRDIRLSKTVNIDYSEASLDVTAASEALSLLRPTAVKAGEPVSITLGTAQSVMLYSLAGQLVDTQANTASVATDGLKPGIYLVNYTVGSTTNTEKLIIL